MICFSRRKAPALCPVSLCGCEREMPFSMQHNKGSSNNAATKKFLLTTCDARKFAREPFLTDNFGKLEIIGLTNHDISGKMLEGE